MASKTVRVCDVYGTHKDVAGYQVTVETVGDDRHAPEGVFVHMADLGPRGLERLLHCVKKGLAKPERKKAKTAK